MTLSSLIISHLIATVCVELRLKELLDAFAPPLLFSLFSGLLNHHGAGKGLPVGCALFDFAGKVLHSAYNGGFSFLSWTHQ